MAPKSSPAVPEKSRQEPRQPMPPIQPHGDAPQTGYYAKVAARYRTAKYLTVFLLVLLLLGGLHGPFERGVLVCGHNHDLVARGRGERKPKHERQGRAEDPGACRRPALNYV